MTSPNQLIPVLPESAPFTPEQRAYLNGFLAGLFSHTAVSACAASSAATRPLEPLAILFGSQTGNAENLAKRIGKEAGKQGFAPTIHDLASYPPAQLSGERNVLIVTSTYGDGEPPDSARGFWDSLQGDTAPKLTGTRFSVCALGDSNYPKFCEFGKKVDSRLEKLGGTRVSPRQDCDADFDEAFAKWLSGAVGALAQGDGPAANANDQAAVGEESTAETVKPGWSKKNPFPARLLANRKLNGEGSSKDVRHFEISLEGSGLSYEVGDALGVVPTNDPALVDELLGLLGFDGEEPVPGASEQPVPVRLAMLKELDITRIPKALLETFAGRTGEASLQKLVAPEANGDLAKFLWGREIIDLLLAHPGVKFTPAEFTALLRKLQPRLYSISSSLKAHPGEVHLTVGGVRYEFLGRRRQGVCSTFLADRVTSDTPVPVFVHSNKAFRPPTGDKPLIMVGPGTGIAPFRAFLEERQATGATGGNWLFFGDQRSATDYLYREELEAFQKDGLLTRLDLAWSRDQAEKIYVQQRLLEHAGELWGWLEEGAGFYVCGDASRMARDVDAALHQVIALAGGKSPEAAAAYVKDMKAAKRYCRDVY